MGDELYMLRCLELAACGAGNVAPNPMVGAILVHDNKIIGEGFHQLFGGVHAEVMAIESVRNENKQFIAEATLYVSLEPCNHFGKTPPCTIKIIENGIKKVVVGVLDPNKSVDGGGIKVLMNSGVDVVCGVIENECRLLNKFFFTYQEKKRPFITLKWAESSDGFIGGVNYKRTKLTNQFSDKLVHKMRAEHMAVFAGGRTILSDDPLLTNRFWKGKSPVRVTLDTKNNFSKQLNIFNEAAPSLIFNFEVKDKCGGVELIKIHASKNQFSEIIQSLFERNINSMLVEGGASTINLLVQQNLWDEMKFFITDKIIGVGIEAPATAGKFISEEYIFGDILKTFHNK